ncbi:MAG TPA: SAM-dependent methyltransferase [Bacillales bacterium]
MKNILRNLIDAQPDRCITYEQFMNTALYHPEKGYYRKPSVKIGKKGDFYTSSSVHPVFGWTAARFFIDLVEQEGLPPVVCEVGAGDGIFAKAVLEEWKRLSPSSYGDLQYLMVEESPFQRKQQNGLRMAENPAVQYDSFQEMQADWPSFSGIVFSNELFDAFPVRVVEKVDGVLLEVKVTIDEKGELVEVSVPCHDQQIFDWIEAYGFPIQEGQRIEIPLVMTHWLEDAADWMERGAIVTIDYGYTEEEWQNPRRKEGSLRGYYRHQLVDNPLYRPSEMDVTANIHVDAIRQIGEDHGLDHLFSITQRDFLLTAGILKHLNDSPSPDPFSLSQRQNRAIGALISEGSLGNAFYAILQGKRLSGRFAESWFARTPIHEAIQKRR